MLLLDQPEMHFAIQAVQQAARLVRRVQAHMIPFASGGGENRTPPPPVGDSVQTKDDLSPVTVADYASQAVIGWLLSQAFPQDALVAEEDSAALRAKSGAPLLARVTGFVQQELPQAGPEQVCAWIDHGRQDEKGAPGRFWALDPIDGTKGFLRGEQYAIALALVEDGQVQIGALGCPNLKGVCFPELGGPGSLIVAQRGLGTWTTCLDQPGEYRRLGVSARAEPAQARLLRSFESGHTNAGQVDQFAAAMGTQAQPVLMDSQAKYALLAAGEAEVLLRLLSPSKPDYREKIWDQAAGALVLEEAGGRITDLDGAPLDFTTGRLLLHNRGVLASNGSLHAAALSALRQIGA